MPPEPFMSYTSCWTLHFALSFLALSGVSFAFGANAREAVPVDGDPFHAQFAGAETQWQLTFLSGGQKRAVPAADLICWGVCPEVPRRPLLVLADGGLLAAEVRRLGKESLAAESELFGSLAVPLELVAGVVFQAPADRRRRELLVDRIATASGDADRLILANDDELAGTLEGIENQIVNLQTSLGAVPVETRLARALILNPSLVHREKPGALRALAGLQDGSRLQALHLTTEGQALKIGLAGGLVWGTARDQLVWLHTLGGRVAYLSDLQPQSHRHVPFLDLAWPYRLDRSVTGSWLRCAERLYPKGLGVHSRSRLTYVLDQPYRRFEADLGIDDETAGRGSVRFRVLVDGSLKYESPTIRGSMNPVPVSLDISGAKQLDLEVDYADRADEMDRADWLGARLVR